MLAWHIKFHFKLLFVISCCGVATELSKGDTKFLKIVKNPENLRGKQLGVSVKLNKWHKNSRKFFESPESERIPF